jgi:hypothetical protein
VTLMNQIGMKRFLIVSIIVGILSIGLVCGMASAENTDKNLTANETSNLTANVTVVTITEVPVVKVTEVPVVTVKNVTVEAPVAAVPTEKATVEPTKTEQAAAPVDTTTGSSADLAKLQAAIEAANKQAADQLTVLNDAITSSESINANISEKIAEIGAVSEQAAEAKAALDAALAGSTAGTENATAITNTTN